MFVFLPDLYWPMAAIKDCNLDGVTVISSGRREMLLVKGREGEEERRTGMGEEGREGE